MLLPLIWCPYVGMLVCMRKVLVNGRNHFMISDSERVACQINYTLSEKKKISINDPLLHDTFFFFGESLD